MAEMLAATSVLEKSQQATADGVDSCEDCPDFNSNPPSKSECPDFGISPEGKPVCNNEGNTHKQQRFAKLWLGGDTADRVCSKLLG